jgi:excisionase family DNA binding protein
MTLRDIMTPEQVAEYLQLDKDTVYRLIRERRLAATRIGRSYRIPRQDLETFLTTHSTRPEVRRALFTEFMALAERNPGLDSDDVLEDLERHDAEQQRRATPA